MSSKNTATALLALLCIFSPAGTATSQGRVQQAESAYLAAQTLEADLKAKPASERSRNEYLAVINAFQRVYLITPHTGYADNSLIAMAQHYEAIDEVRAAVRTLNFLLSEYPTTSFAQTAQETIARLEGNAGKSRSTQTGSVDNVRYWEAPNSVRVVVDVTGNPTITQGEALNPKRAFIDISPAKVKTTMLNKQWMVRSGMLEQIRIGQFDATTVRVVLDVSAIATVTSSTLKDPSRVVIDVLSRELTGVEPSPVQPATQPASPRNPVTRPATASLSEASPAVPAVKAPPAGGSGTTTRSVATSPTADVGVPPSAPVVKTADANKIVTPAKPTNDGNRSLIRTLGLKLSRVVIDAGHGGHDTGSIGPTGYMEKDFVLDVAVRLKELVETELGAEVVMTRTKDVFVPLEARTALANQEAADLFISVHANSSRVRSVRGVETFFLNITSSREALETASRENATADGSIHELEDMVKKIMMRDKLDESRELAEHVQKAMAGRKQAGPNRGVKQAPFVVLIGASMPSVLAEIAFISNPQEELLIKTPKYRQQIAESLFEGVRSYTETLSGIKAAQRKDQQE
jgi:N-acetylmuramoyl-L-alanine amidase